mgnify:CR=1 FL=1
MPVRPKEVWGIEEGDGLTMEMEEDIGGYRSVEVERKGKEVKRNLLIVINSFNNASGMRTK